MTADRTPQIGEVWTSARTGDVTIVAVGPEHVAYLYERDHLSSCWTVDNFLRHFTPPAEPWPDLPSVRWGFQVRSDGFVFTSTTEVDARRYVAHDPANRRLICWTPEVVE